MDSSGYEQSIATLALIVVTVALSIAAFASEGLWRFLALEPYRMVRTHQYHPVVTAGLIHGDLAHLFVNMLTLFIFGPALESTVDGPLFVTIYLVSLVFGNLYPLLKYRNQPEYIAIGASGAVAGVLFSYCLFYPLQRIYVMMLIPMPAFLFAILYVAYSIYSMRNRRDNIGHEAHLAGGLAGVATTIVAVPGVIEHLWGMFG
ncbi:MAG TPA: rhomboid family intramembrane serine protease [Candidatus Kapabacteria bacterium]|jgi:membrane associated rhomboid family serine protease|nr:rhomboid family intramembrane serine protease [Candidatus Kapabacteria bacterium]